MGRLVETITNYYHGDVKGCVRKIDIYDTQVVVTRHQMSDVTYELTGMIGSEKVIMTCLICGKKWTAGYYQR